MHKKIDHIANLGIVINADGGIELKQFSSGGHCDISLHPSQVRHLFELAGHLLPPPSTDELTQRLARQLCEVRMELIGEQGRSPGIDCIVTLVGAYCDCLPNAVFPFDLYPDSRETEVPEAAKVRHPDFQPQAAPGGM
jgi:hypothetical protein